MQSLEYKSGPLLDNHYYSVTGINNNLELLERIKKQKEDLIYRHINPAQVDTVRHEIVESWVHSLQNGHDILNPKRGPILPDSEFKVLLSEKEDLIKIARSYFRRVEPIFFNTNCTLLLADEHGVNLLDTYHQDNRDIYLGEIGTEETVGTSAQSISLIHEYPFQLFGPEHYFEDWSRSAASACPIFDFNHNLIGILSISSRYDCDQTPQTLGLVVTMALVLQNELNIKVNHDLLNSSLEATDKGVVILNNKGFITNANIQARNLFSSLSKELSGVYFENIFGHQPAITNVLQTGKLMKDIDIEIEKSREKFHLVSIQPFRSLNRIVGCVIFIRKIERTQLMVPQPVTSQNHYGTRYTFEDIIGNSSQLFKSISIAKKICICDVNILIQGESGTGKELFAQAIHNESRPNGSFIPVNCAAIPKTLIESELFGYEGGAFTGAEHKGRMGKIEIANGGTLFLDEIGDMPLDLQPVLLRVLEEKKFMRVGGNRFIPVNFRLVAATNSDLLRMVENNLFRQDLYYRLAALKIAIPPLREREADITLLAKHILGKYCRNQAIPIPSFSPTAEYQLMHYAWPGNVRQLENAIIYALKMSSGTVIDYEDLPEEIKMETPIYVQKAVVHQDNDNYYSLKDIEKSVILETLLKNKNNICETASILGLSRTTLYRKIKDYDILK